MNSSFGLHCTNFIILLFLFVWNTNAQKNREALIQKSHQLKVFDTLNQSKIMVLGINHFSKDVLSTENQNGLIHLTEVLGKFQPTKIVLELQPKALAKMNQEYQNYVKDSSFISDKYNEVYQLGFRLARKMSHDSIYLFDDQTEFIGSLEGFTFDAFGAYAQENDAGFYDRYLKEITDKFQNNQTILKQQNLLNQIVLRNSPMAQKFNAQRMHSFEIRVGIQKSWIGPDWLGRFYRRNIRMMANVMKFNRPEDRILIIVGDNHKWILDELFENTPDFELVSSWHLLLSHMD